MARDSTTLTTSHFRSDSIVEPMYVPALVLVWSAMQPWRVGEVALLDPQRGPFLLGRGDSSEQPIAEFAWQRPTGLDRQPPLAGPRISRRQLLLFPHKNQSLGVERIGRCPMIVGGNRVDKAELMPGDILELEEQLTFWVTSRPSMLPALDALPEHAVPCFGAADPYGIVGESPVIWTLREQLAFAAVANQHVLLLGESGSGKELGALAIHALSSRASKAMISRNAATLPSGIIDAELFGNVRDYPNPGMRERPGIIGEADGSTLFLDEIGELPHDLQAHLLRVLDAGGEYQRLGDARPRRAHLRIVAATNRDPDQLKHDLLARLTLRIRIPGLDERREDIPLLVRRLVKQAMRASAMVGQRFVQHFEGGHEEPRITQSLMTRMLRLAYSHHVRDLEQVLWRAMSTSRRHRIEDTPEVQEAYPVASPIVTLEQPELTPQQIRQALDAHGGNVTHTARALGLSSRFALYRLMKKWGLE
ncbi:MAG TPA: sigma 54-interacting transcriptional regulator [Polyangiaceae bacterium]|jgi:two-component system nitrogen regulation response regulator GlnG/two-component system response regulator HydG|nr:MAG: Transcriptional regulatory protein QseF [Deltaproteobacteria bacterium ADurb.Bin207]HNS98848.1 sigma 54-interacting transcriptional regulator [Polyangiaceae bacterium]HNZ25487.1 sigma 54-interacting transcriptional regulator [Polyangiaceae bacterium]HOD25726.1 sigma 54-interacting transcriptional regulator [Polyangiaceae bacterium]HOE51461.1 sigma 54-interacting transcriptional regulator [Polyangiaceae bacterium]